jgi:hypothetical protein
MYNVDGPELGAAFISCDITSAAARATDDNPCLFCLLWLRAYRRVFGETDVGSKEMDGTDYFTYYITTSDLGS